MSSKYISSILIKLDYMTDKDNYYPPKNKNQLNSMSTISFISSLDCNSSLASFVLQYKTTHVQQHTQRQNRLVFCCN